MIHPKIDSIPVQLGDLVHYREVPNLTLFTDTNATRILGWSQCGQFLYIGWAGVVETGDCEWATDLGKCKFARLYRPVAENRWQEAIALNLIPRRIQFKLAD